MNAPFDHSVHQLDLALLAEIQDGLPLSPGPYAEVAKRLNLTEAEVIVRLEKLQQDGIIKRFGLVLQHRPLGYRANAMVVWDVPDEDVDDVAQRVAGHDFVTLCYCRARRAPVWPYNLYCMIHGRERVFVEQQIAAIKKDCGLSGFPTQTLFSLRRFKQTGARFNSRQDRQRTTETNS